MSEAERPASWPPRTFVVTEDGEQGKRRASTIWLNQRVAFFGFFNDAIRITRSGDPKSPRLQHAGESDDLLQITPCNRHMKLSCPTAPPPPQIVIESVGAPRRNATSRATTCFAFVWSRFRVSSVPQRPAEDSDVVVGACKNRSTNVGVKIARLHPRRGGG